MKYLFFDTETTGLHPKGLSYKTAYERFPHIVQIAWILTDEKDVLVRQSHIIRPNNYVIPIETVKIHGITQERALTEGVDLLTVLRHFIVDAQVADKIVAHNIYFDTSNVKASLMRIESYNDIIESSLDKTKRIDTMKSTIQYVGARYDDGRPGKWPKLEELYEKLFSKKFEDAHDALVDVEALMKCYFQLVKLGIL